MQTASRRANIEQKLNTATPSSLTLLLSPLPVFLSGILTGSRRVCRSTTYAMLCTNFMHVQCVKHLKRHRAAQLGSLSSTSFPLLHHLLPPVVSITFWHRHHLRYSRSGFRLVRNHHRPPTYTSPVARLLRTLPSISFHFVSNFALAAR